METFNRAELMLRFLVKAAKFYERQVAANQNTVFFHTQEQTLSMAKASWGRIAAGEHRIRGNADVTATVNPAFMFQSASNEQLKKHNWLTF